MTVDWNPAQYHRFVEERSRPARDLLAMVQPTATQRMARGVDLGCGSGELTAMVADQLHVADMVGIDSSPAMLADAQAHARPGLHFQAGDIAEWTSLGDHQLVFANAALQWVPEYDLVLRRWRDGLAPGGQLAVQVPANAHMPSHVVADQVAHQPRFLEAFGTAGPPLDPVAHHVLAPEDYAVLLHDLGFVEEEVLLRVYPHVLPSSRHVVEWVRGTTLTRFQKRLDPDVFEAFVAEYETQLLDVIGRHEPHFFPFRRILFWGRLPG